MPVIGLNPNAGSRGAEMSRFVDKLKQVSQAVPQSMGFRSAQPVSVKPRILLIASLAQADIDDLADRVAGADAGLLSITKLSSGANALGKVSQAVSDIPWGGWLRDIAEGEVERVTKTGFDFVVFPPASTPLATLKDDKVGKILEIGATLSEGLLRAVDALPVDAVLVTNEQEGEYFLTWQHLMFFQRCADLLSKPLLVSIPSKVSANELQALWEAGVNGVVVGVGTGQPVERLRELRQVIDKLVFPPQRERRKTEALLPYTSISGELDITTEEEEE
jgi:hypothetical protein